MSVDPAGQGRAQLVSSLRRLSKPAQQEPSPGNDELCDLCGAGIQAKHNHLLQLTDRRILCVCSSCWAEGAADPEMRPTGTRVLWLEGFELPDELWAKLEVPIGLAFFMRSTGTGGVVAQYPSPAGATESELDLRAWDELCAVNPVLGTLEADIEALIVNRVSEPPQFAIAPIDECYMLVGAIKSSWEGISGGEAVERTVPVFFDELRGRARVEAR
jgi:Family of unknown function (DUF5947)